jgi:hypothetical protein
MREILSIAELHQRFVHALAEHPVGRNGTFVFEIDQKDPGDDGCNWYPMAAIQHWRGDLRSNLAAFREVRETMSRAYNVDAAADARTRATAGAA